MQDNLFAIQDKEQNDVLPLSSFQSEDLFEKLKMLNFEKQLMREFKMKPFARFYFVKQVNPGEQFFMFTLICWWLCKKLGKEIDEPHESDDPNIYITKIMQILESIDVQVDFSPNKLIRGAGPVCLFVLNCLATQALKIGEVSCHRPQIAEEDEERIEYLDENAEIILEKVEDEYAEHSDESEMELDRAVELTDFSRFFLKQTMDFHHNKTKSNEDTMIDTFSDQQQWRLELERVMPKLKVFVKTDARDWRSHFSHMETLKLNIDSISDETQQKLKKLHNEFTYSLDKVESREKHLNNELQILIRSFKEISIELSSLQHAEGQILKDADHFTSELKKVVMENDMKRIEMEKRGQTMSDGSSVLHIKKAIAKLKEDVSQLNLEVALLGHSIDQEVLRNLASFVE